MDITYGISGEEAKVYVPTAIAAVESVINAGIPGAFYVDQIPICELQTYQF